MLVAFRRDLRRQAPQRPLASDHALGAQLHALQADVARPVQELALQEIAAGAVVRIRGVEPADGRARREHVDRRRQVRVHEVRARRPRRGREVDRHPAVEGRRLGPARRPLVAGGVDGIAEPEAPPPARRPGRRLHPRPGGPRRRRADEPADGSASAAMRRTGGMTAPRQVGGSLVIKSRNRPGSKAPSVPRRARPPG